MDNVASQDLLKLINIRELRATDLNFILDSTVKCLAQYTESMFKGWNYNDTCEYLEAVTLSILQHPDYSTFIACHAEDDNNILGYIVADSTSNHILLQFTKYVYRGLGIQALLLPLVIDLTLPITVNFQTKTMLRLAKQSRVTIADKHTTNLIILLNEELAA